MYVFYVIVTSALCNVTKWTDIPAEAPPMNGHFGFWKTSAAVVHRRYETGCARCASIHPAGVHAAAVASVDFGAAAGREGQSFRTWPGCPQMKHFGG